MRRRNKEDCRGKWFRQPGRLLLASVAAVSQAFVPLGISQAQAYPPPAVDSAPLEWPRIAREIAFDSKGPVPDLAELHVFEDGIEQPHVSLRKDDEPVSVCLLLDLSSSMKASSSMVMEAARRFVGTSHPTDETEVAGFTSLIFLEKGYTTDPGQIEATLRTLQFQGGSSLFDAVTATIDQMNRHVPKFRPVIVIISDGDDNYSHVTAGTVARKLMIPYPPTVYSLSPPADSTKGMEILTLITKATGGISIQPAKLSLLPDSAAMIAQDIHSRYRLEYTSTHSQRDGKLHKLEVRFQPASGASKPKTIFRQEYYAPSQ